MLSTHRIKYILRNSLRRAVNYTKLAEAFDWTELRIELDGAAKNRIIDENFLFLGIFAEKLITNESHCFPLNRRRVPQGLVPGSVLFLLHENDLHQYPENLCQAIMYADDTVLTLGNKSIKPRVQNHLQLSQTGM